MEGSADVMAGSPRTRGTTLVRGRIFAEPWPTVRKTKTRSIASHDRRHGKNWRLIAAVAVAV